MRLEWVQERLQRWAAWVEERQGYVKPLKMDDVPGGGSGDGMQRDYSNEEATERALLALFMMEPSHESASLLRYVYLLAPRKHVTTMAEMARRKGVPEKTFWAQLERAEKKFANIVDYARGASKKEQRP